ncbi:unnamed protein product [Closterium sp. Naga37s-1]|nr:unnamed protein product [Closterium sp. Naga37s-1]
MDEDHMMATNGAAGGASSARTRTAGATASGTAGGGGGGSATRHHDPVADVLKLEQQLFRVPLEEIKASVRHGAKESEREVAALVAAVRQLDAQRSVEQQAELVSAQGGQQGDVTVAKAAEVVEGLLNRVQELKSKVGIQQQELKSKINVSFVQQQQHMTHLRTRLAIALLSLLSFPAPLCFLTPQINVSFVQQQQHMTHLRTRLQATSALVASGSGSGSGERNGKSGATTTAAVAAAAGGAVGAAAGAAAGATGATSASWHMEATGAAVLAGASAAGAGGAGAGAGAADGAGGAGRSGEGAGNGEGEGEEEGGVRERLVQEWKQQRLQRVLVDYLMREGHLETAGKLAQELHLQEWVDSGVYESMLAISSALHQQDCAPALHWCSLHRSRLKRLKSGLEFRLRVQEFIERVRQGQLKEAVGYARAHLAPFAASHLPQLQQALATLALRSSTQCPKYKALFAQSQWESLQQLFHRTACDLHGLPHPPLLHIYMQAGLSVLKTPLSYEPGCPKADPLSHASFRHLALPLPLSKRNHSQLVCRISHRVMDYHNPPLVLPNGYVYSKQAMEDMARRSNGLVTCPSSSPVCLPMPSPLPPPMHPCVPPPCLSP